MTGRAPVTDQELEQWAKVRADDAGHLARELIKYRRATSAPTEQDLGSGDHPIGWELSRIPEQLTEGGGAWRACSGCHELNEGHPTGEWSDILKSHLGLGCSECGGIGAVWDNTDYSRVNEPDQQKQGYPIEDEDRRKWIVWWQGSGPARGDHIMLMTAYDMGYARELAYLGDQHHDAAHALVNAHNATVAKLRAALAAEGK